jgi:hypothetical protein
MKSPATLASPTLCFDRAGRRLLAIEPDAISVLHVDRSDTRDETRRIPRAGARAVVGFDDQIWIATADALVRVDATGRSIGAPAPLGFAEAPILAPTPYGPPAALWASTPATMFVDDFGSLARLELADADAIVPLTGRRHVVARGARVMLPSGCAAQLAPGSTVLGGGVLADGRAVTLLVAGAGGRQLVTMSIASGLVLHRIKIPMAIARLATRRGRVVVQVEPRVLCVIDLRTGQETAAFAIDADVEDVAIDPDGIWLAARARDRIDVNELAELARPATSIAAPAELPVDDEPRDVAPVVASVPVAAAIATSVEPPASLACPPLVALQPRAAMAVADRAAAIAQLDRELRRVSLWALVAIANAWDSRRIGYGDEGRHPFEHEVAAILGCNGGHAEDHVAAARGRLVEHERELAFDPRWRATETPIGWLVAELGLSERAIDVLIVVAAAALWGEIARLYGILANDPGRAAVDELAVQQVLATRHDRHDVAAELDPRAPLVRLGLVHVSSKRARPFGELAVDPVILDALRGTPPDLGDATRVVDCDRALASLDIPRNLLERAIAALARPTAQPARIVVRGRIGAGRKTLLAALAQTAGRRIAVIDALALPRDPDRFVGALRASLRRAQLAGHVPCVAQLEDVTFDERPARELAADTLRLHPGPLAIVSSPDAVAPFPAGHVAIDLPPLDEAARLAVWRRAIAEVGVVVARVDALAARYRIGPGLIRRAAIAARDAIGDGASDASSAIDAYIRQTRDARLAQYARRVDRLATWSDIVLPPDVLDSLRELVGRVRHGRTVFETWGMQRIGATARGLTALFQGSPGTGKTLVAGVIARELGLELYQVDLSKVMSKWIGETERNLSHIFDAAEDGQVVLLFDEADSLFAKRTEVRSSNDRYANLEVNYLLQRLDAFAGIAILTTNAGTSIDQAFKRRMSFRLSFPFPDEDTREQLWRAHLPAELPTEGPLSLGVLARKYQLSGGYIRNACLRAAFLAAQEETTLHQHHLERAVALEFAELGKLSSSGAID